MQNQHKQLCMEYMDAKSMEEVDVKYYVIRAWWLSTGTTTKEGMYNLSSGWNYGITVIDNVEVTCSS